MKKILLCAVVALLSMSCEVSDYGEPMRTLKAKKASESVFQEISREVQLMTMVNRLDQWYMSTTDSARYAVEDRYFKSYKLRNYGDSISVKGVEYGYYTRDVNLMVHTGGQSIKSVASSWEVVLSPLDSVNVECTVADKWSLSYGTEGSIVSEFGELQFAMLDANDTTFRYSVDGRGHCHNIQDDYHYNKPSGSFVVTKELCVAYRTERTLWVDVAVLDDYLSVDFYDRNKYISFDAGGALSFEEGVEMLGKDAATLTIVDDGCTVAYRGFVESWGSLYSDVWWR